MDGSSSTCSNPTPDESAIPDSAPANNSSSELVLPDSSVLTFPLSKVASLGHSCHVILTFFNVFELPRSYDSQVDGLKTVQKVSTIQADPGGIA